MIDIENRIDCRPYTLFLYYEYSVYIRIAKFRTYHEVRIIIIIHSSKIILKSIPTVFLTMLYFGNTTFIWPDNDPRRVR